MWEQHEGSLSSSKNTSVVGGMEQARSLKARMRPRIRLGEGDLFTKL